MYHGVLKFWFEEIKPAQWWAKVDQFDTLIAERYFKLHCQAVQGELFAWRENSRGRLAEIIVLDQFSRNIFRNSPLAFANDQMALTLAQEAVAQGIDMQLTPVERGFIYLPYMHSESRKIHEAAETIYRRHGNPASLRWELKHKSIIDTFGRYPHRNAILGRESTEEELIFLQQPNSGF